MPLFYRNNHLSCMLPFISMQQSECFVCGVSVSASSAGMDKFYVPVLYTIIA